MTHDDGPATPFDRTHVTSIDDGDRPTEVVVIAVAAITGNAPDGLSPLYDAIDPDALDALVAHGRRTDADLELTFAYESCEVVVHGNGRVEITETVPRAA